MPIVGGFIAGALGIGGTAWGAAGFAGFTAGATFGATALGGIAVKLAISVAFSALSAALQDKPKTSVAGIRTNQVMTGGVNPETFVLGEYATSGAMACPPMSHTNGGPPNGYLNYVIELAGIPGHALQTLILDGEAVTIGTTPHSDGYGLPIEGRFSGAAWIKYYNGTQTTTDAMLLAKYPAPLIRPWASGMVGTGICYAILTFRYDREVFQGWPQARFVLGGVPLYDPRRDSSIGGAGSQRWGQPATYLGSTNTAVQIYNVLRGIHFPSGDIWGGDIPAEDVPFAAWVPEMDICDVLVSDGDGGTEAQYRSGLEVMADDAPFSVISELQATCAGQVIEDGGVWSIRVGGPRLPVLFITDADLLADETEEFTPFPDIGEIFNGITATYVDPQTQWESREADPLYNAVWEAEDDDRRLMTSLALPACPYAVQVARVMAALIADHRRMRKHVLSLPCDALVLQALDTISWTSDINGYSAKLFEIKEIDRDFRSGRVRVLLREVDPDDYDPPTGLVRPSPPDLRSVIAAVQAVPGWGVSAVEIQDGAGQARRPGIRAVWDADAATDARGLRIAVRLAGDTGDGIERPLQDMAPGAVEFEGLPATGYQLRAQIVVDRATAWSAWLPVTTPDVRLGVADVDQTMRDTLAEATVVRAAVLALLDAAVLELRGEATAAGTATQTQLINLGASLTGIADGLAAEVLSRVAGATENAAQLRGYRDSLRGLVAEVLEGVSNSDIAREELRRSLTAQLGDLGASFAEKIITLAGESSASALRITTLEATSATLTAAVTQTDLALVDGLDAVAALISGLSVGSAVQFDHAAIWYFDDTAEGWTGDPTAPATTTQGWLRPGAASSVTSPTGLSIAGKAYAQLRARLRRVGTPTWAGEIWWADVGQSFDVARRVIAPAPTWDGDLAVLTVNPVWAGNIDAIRLGLATGADATNYYELDWVAIGRPAPGASSADLNTEKLARISGDSALTVSVETLDTRLTTSDGVQQGQATALSGLNTRVDATETGLTTQSGRIDLVETGLGTTNGTVSGLSTAIDSLTSETGNQLGGQVSQAGALRALQSSLRALAAEEMEGRAQDHQATQAVRDYVAKAAQSLNTRVNVTDSLVAVVAEAVTALQAAIPGLATADALQALTTTVTQQGSTLGAVANSVISLTSTLEGLSGTVSNKLNASVIDGYYTKVETDGVASSAAASASSAIKATMEGSGGSVKAAQDAANAANTLAGSKGKVIVQVSAPTGANRAAENLWINITGGLNKPHRWDGSAWVAVTDKVATDAAAAAAAAQTAATAAQTAATAASAAVTSESNARVVADQAIADQVTAVNAALGTTNATVSTQATALAQTQGRLAARYLLEVAVDGSGATIEAIASADGVGGTLSIITLNSDVFRFAGSFAEFLGPVKVQALHIGENEITIPQSVFVADHIDVNSTVTEVTLAELAVAKSARADMSFGLSLAGMGGGGALWVTVYRDTTAIRGFPLVTGQDGRRTTTTITLSDQSDFTGNVVYRLKAKLQNPVDAGGWSAPVRTARRFLSVTQFRR